ncbi:oxidoreductase [Streptomyces niveus]|uniref:oxidoreductase n=1 Tax=Streptomyces niveus TaxID=193462 RepID=UPI0036C098ED
MRGPRDEPPPQLRDVTVANRVWMSPMAQYSAAPDGEPTDWHLVHYGARAVGGAGLIMIEATAVGPSHRCTAADLGLWNEEQAAAHRRLTSFISEQGAVPAIQLQAAGRKGSHKLPWDGLGQNDPVRVGDGGWGAIAPSTVPFGDLSLPREASHADLREQLPTRIPARRRDGPAGCALWILPSSCAHALQEDART